MKMWFSGHLPSWGVVRDTLFAVAVAVACAAASGCATIKMSRVGKVMVDVENTNWLLFNFIPLASGNPDRPNEADCLFFQNTVDLENNIHLVNYAMNKTGAIGVRDLVSYTTDEYVLFVLLKHHSMHTSAELVMPGDETRGLEFQKLEALEIKQEKLAENPTKEILKPLPDPAPARKDREKPLLKIMEF